jgi:hypothetical protein
MLQYNSVGHHHLSFSFFSHTHSIDCRSNICFSGQLPTYIWNAEIVYFIWAFPKIWLAEIEISEFHFSVDLGKNPHSFSVVRPDVCIMRTRRNKRQECCKCGIGTPRTRLAYVNWDWKLFNDSAIARRLWFVLIMAGMVTKSTEVIRFYFHDDETQVVVFCVTIKPSL